MANLFNFVVNFTAKSTNFIKHVHDSGEKMDQFRKKTRRATDESNKGFRKVAKGIGLVSAGLTALSGLGLGKLLQDQRDYADGLDQTTRKLGIGVEALTAWRFAAADAAELGAGQFDTAMQRMVRRAAEAAQGTGEAKDAFRELGIDAQTFNQLPTDQKLLRIADGLAAVPAQADKVRLAFKLFDTEGVQLVNLLGDGSGAIKSLLAEAGALGAVLTEQELKAALQADAMVTRTEAIIGAAQTRFALGFAPIIAVGAEMLNSWTVAAGGVHGITERIEGFIAKTVGKIIDNWNKVRRIYLVVAKAGAKAAAFVFEAQQKFSDMTGGVYERMQKRIAGSFEKLFHWVGDLLQKAAKVLPDFAGGEAVGAVAAGFNKMGDFAEKFSTTAEGAHGRAADSMRAYIAELDTALAELEKVGAGAEMVRAMIEDIKSRAGAPNQFAGDPNQQPNGLGLNKDEAEFERLRESLRTKEQIEMEAFARRQALIDQNAASEQERMALREQLAAQHQNTLLALAEQGMLSGIGLEQLGADAKNKIALSSGKQLLGNLAQFSKTAFKIQKIMTIGESVLAIQGGIAKAMNNPWPLNLVAAAQVAAQGASIIGQIKSLGHGGSKVPTVGGRSAGSAAVGRQSAQAGGGQAPARQEIIIRQEGALQIPREAIETLIRELNDATDDGLQIKVA